MFECSTRDLPSLLEDNFRGFYFKEHKIIKAVTTNSQKVPKDSLFVPLKGIRHDAHDFIEDALKNGALCALTERSIEASPLPLIGVKNSERALAQLAEAWRIIAAPKILIGLTGSNGKTSTKEFIRHLARTTRKVSANEGNLNNHLGVPLTLLELPRQADVAVIEMGMNHLGEIAHLAKIAQPNWGVITGIGTAHIGELGSVENICKAKWELAEGLKNNPHLFVGLNHPSLVPRLEAWTHPTTIVSFKNVPLSKTLNKPHFHHVRISSQQVSINKLEIHLEENGESRTLQVPLFGIHFAMNLTLAIKVAESLGTSPRKINHAMETLVAPSMRMEVLQPKGFSSQWIVDCYNANPDSLKSLISTLASLRLHGKDKRPIVMVIGDMKELGPESENHHRAIAPELLQLKPWQLLTFGKDSKALSEAYLSIADSDAKAFHFDSHADLQGHLKSFKSQNMLIALKASRSTELEKSLPF